MLKEDHSLSDKSQWKKVKSSFHKDKRYRAIESSSRREELFNEFIKCLNRVSKRGDIFNLKSGGFSNFRATSQIRRTILSHYMQTCSQIA